MGSKFSLCCTNQRHESLSCDLVIKRIIYHNKWVVFKVVTKAAEIFPMKIEKKNDWKTTRDKLKANMKTNETNFTYNKDEESYKGALSRFYKKSEKIKVNYTKTSTEYETGLETYRLIVEV